MGKGSHGAAVELSQEPNGGLGRRSTAEAGCPSVRVSVENIRVVTASGRPIVRVPGRVTIRPGRLTGVLGPSGCGKSTFLKLIGGKHRGLSSGILSALPEHGNMPPRVLFNGCETGFEQGLDTGGGVSILFRGSAASRAVSYVPQDDVLDPVFSPREMCLYVASLQQPQLSPEERCELVDELLGRLGLGRIADNLIGKPGRNQTMSGGQRRRVSIALGLIKSPALLLMDEPTSGLDSSSSVKLCVLLREIAHSANCAVAVVIHQPSIAIQGMLDDLVLFDRSGKLVYSGDGLLGPDAGEVDFSKLTSITLMRNPMLKQLFQIPEGANPLETILTTCEMDNEAAIHRTRTASDEFHRTATLEQSKAAQEVGAGEAPDDRWMDRYNENKISQFVWFLLMLR